MNLPAMPMRLASGLSPGFPLALSLPPFSLFRAAIIFSPLWCYPSPCLPAARGTGREYRFARLIDSGCNCSTNERPLIIIRFRVICGRGKTRGRVSVDRRSSIPAARLDLSRGILGLRDRLKVKVFSIFERSFGFDSRRETLDIPSNGGYGNSSA